MRIICSLHFDSKSMCFEVIIGRFWVGFFLLLLGFFVEAFEKCHTDLWGQRHRAAHFCSVGGTFCTPPGSDMGELTLWDMHLGCSSL